VGTLGRIGSFSFQQSKGMTSGEGGFLTTQDDALADRIYSLKNCGRKRTQASEFGFGGNYRMTEFQAAILLAQLDRLEGQLEIKRERRRRLREALAKVPGIVFTVEKPQVTRQGLYGFAYRFDPKAFGGLPMELMTAALQAEGIPVQRPYDVVYRSPLWTSGKRFLPKRDEPRAEAGLGLPADCPVAVRIAEHEGLVLPHQVFLGSERDMDDIARAHDKIQRHAGELRFQSMEKKIRRSARQIMNKTGFGA
jgi:dTDP-4-amino-4,6-dideoxygalactose transaminase